MTSPINRHRRPTEDEFDRISQDRRDLQEALSDLVTDLRTRIVTIQRRAEKILREMEAAEARNMPDLDEDQLRYDMETARAILAETGEGE
jgi:hypothetical protein